MTHAAPPEEARYSDVVHHANVNPSVSYVARKTGIGHQVAARLLEMALKRGDLSSGDYSGRRLDLYVEDGTRALTAEIDRLRARVLELEADVSHKDAYAEQLGRELALATAQAERAPLTQVQRIEVCTTATTDFYAGKYSSLQFAVLDHTQRAHGIKQGNQG